MSQGANTGEAAVEAVVNAAAPAEAPASLQGHQLVTVVINIHDDAVQQALQQAQHDLHSAQLHSASLQQQIETLTAQLHATNQTDAAPLPEASEVSMQNAASPASNQDDTHTADAGQKQAEAKDTAQVANGTSPPVPDTTAASCDGELKDLRQQLQDVRQQADDAVAQHAAAQQLVDSLQAQLAQQGSSLEAETGKARGLEEQLSAAQRSCYRAVADVLRFRSAILEHLLPLGTEYAMAVSAWHDTLSKPHVIWCFSPCLVTALGVGLALLSTPWFSVREPPSMLASIHCLSWAIALVCIHVCT